MENIAWNIIDKYFKDNPFNLVAHHLDSFNHFIEVSIPQIFKENNPVKYLEKEDKLDANTIPKQCSLYLGGKDAKLIYFGKPIIYDETINGEPNPHYMFPNDARLRNILFGSANIGVPVQSAIYRRIAGEHRQFMHLYLIQSSAPAIPSMAQLLGYPGSNSSETTGASS